MIGGCILRAAGSAAGWALAHAGVRWDMRMPTNEELDELIALLAPDTEED
jgi:hypothetical protein